MKKVTPIDNFENNIKNYIWNVGEWESNGIIRKINESEVGKFMDFLDEELKKLKENSSNHSKTIKEDNK